MIRTYLSILTSLGVISISATVLGTPPVYEWIEMGNLEGIGPEHFEGEAYDINDSGQVTGWSPGGGNGGAFIWTPGGTDGVAANPQMKSLGSVLTHPDSTSMGLSINNLGQVAGLSGVPAEVHAFLWTPGGTDGVAHNPQMKDLGVVWFESATFKPLALNDNGWVVTTVIIGEGYEAAQRTKVITPSGSFILPAVGAPELYYTINPYSINNLNHITGLHHHEASQLYERNPFMWTPEGGTQSIGSLDIILDINDQDQLVTEAPWTALNDAGHFVGGHGYSGGEGFLWSEEGGFTYLDDIVTNPPLDIPDFNFDLPEEINNNGWIAGNTFSSETGEPLGMWVVKPVEQTCYLGDTDGDLDVDFDDFLNQQNFFGDPGPDSPGDADCDGDDDFDDYLAVQNFWGTNYNPGLTLVPEPGSAMLAIGVGTFIIRRRR